ncbi:MULTISPECIES: LysR family transcriptional regulator [Paraburkholderia]|uniref:LysR family transcriptional regulator n=1 Tax=Paraburkholderia madseniana TaxID=2599607 RepID=A0AAP5BKP1_9BURK|nr:MULTISPECIES: LysR family transcriptional regulator [Paraburkholderia]MCX4151530.1 LysR family transcriptional regulator [Paraburkholderia madseniana]MDN7154461.1 LysR family transcriptional regulator [Paraburkholderia sp. WS6]MDQ6413343.1 LysR family transcriptional regulator [Paraburkholderia madseniana]
MDRLEAMTILLAAIDTGSLSAASRKLRIPLATVSRRVSELEEHLNIRLLVRGTRKLTLTEAGRGYVASCRRILEDIAEVERTASGEYHAPQGELIISMPPVMGRIHVLPVIVEFLRAFPQIRMGVQLTDRFVNLLEDRVDLTIRIGALPSSSLISTRIGLVREMLCASPAYLKKRGVPKKPEDLVSHDCVAYEGYGIGSDWEFRSKGTLQTIQVPSRLVVNSVEAALVAAIDGAGIARVASYQIGNLVKSRTLVKLLEAYEPLPAPVSLMYASQGQIPLKLRAFLDFAIPRLRKRLGYMHA